MTNDRITGPCRECADLQGRIAELEIGLLEMTEIDPSCECPVCSIARSLLKQAAPPTPTQFALYDGNGEVQP